MAAHAAPATHRQPSRKGKTAWRKNVDVSDIQSGLDELRTDIIHGGPVGEKAADQLFVTDVAGDDEIAQRQRTKKKLRVDEILAHRDSKVEALPPARKRKADDHRGSGAGGKRVKGNGEYISHRELRRLRSVADGGAIGLLAHEPAGRDLWGAPERQREEFGFLEKPKDKVAPRSLHQAPTPLTASGKAVTAVPKPNAGKSYNPLLRDWSALLAREGQAAVAVEQARLLADAQQAERERRAAAEAARADARDKEEYATDYESAWESEWDGIASGAEREDEDRVTPKPKPRKTPAERNRARARKQREAREAWERKQKARAAQEQRIAEIARQVSAKRQPPPPPHADSSSSSSSDEDAASRRLAPRRFGRLAVPDAPLELTLPEDLNDSLRRLKPEGSLLTDRYRTLLINGKLEVRAKVGQVKKPRRHRTEKWSYKDFRLP